MRRLKLFGRKFRWSLLTSAPTSWRSKAEVGEVETAEGAVVALEGEDVAAEAAQEVEGGFADAILFNGLLLEDHIKEFQDNLRTAMHS